MPSQVVDQFTLYRNERFYAAFPAVVTLRSGRVALAFRRAPDHRWLMGEIADAAFNEVDHVHFRSHIAFGVLNKERRLSVEPDILPVHAEAGDQDGNLFVSSAGRLFQYSFLWYPVTREMVEKLPEKGFGILSEDHMGAGYIFGRAYIRYSDDEGQTWAPAYEVPLDPIAPPRRKPLIQGTAAIRGQMIELDNGDLLLATYYASLADMNHDSVRILRSCDGGEGWAYTDQHIFNDKIALQEPTLARWPSGKITLFCRTKFNEDQLVVAQSSDARLNFAQPKTIAVTGHPYSALALPDGRLFLCYGYRHSPMGVRARLVEPGQNIEAAEEIIIRDDSLSRDTGYPSAAMLPGGQILVSYYIPDDKGIRGIEASIVDVNEG